MRIVYLVKINELLDTGVQKKISEQREFWQSRGHNVEYINLWQERKLKLAFFLQQYIYSSQLYKTFNRDEKQIIYIRFSLLPLLNFFLKSNNSKIITEINSNYDLELNRYNLFKSLTIRAYYSIILKKSRHIIQISDSCLTKKRFQQKLTTIGNSIKCTEQDIVQCSKRENSFSKFIFIGNPNAPWHGVNRIIEIFESPESRFTSLYIIGYSSKDLPIIKSEKIHVLGRKCSNELENLVKSSEIGIGSLNMHSINMKYSSSLKNKEYLKYGLNVVMQGEDREIVSLNCVYSLPFDFNNKDFWIAIESLKTREKTKPTDIYNAISSEVIEKRRLTILQKVFDNGRA